MKKALVILLALTMVMSMFAVVPFGASAADELAVGQVAADYKPEGTAINTAAEFAAMDPAGTYYLAADITIEATYEKNFTGTFDGNGKVITTTVPVFEILDGTAKNITIKGSIEATYVADTAAEGYIGSLAKCAGNTAAAYITNVCNMAPLTSNIGACGGIVGMVSNDQEFDVIFTDVVNYGNITCDGDGDSGGIVGQFDGNDSVERYYCQFINCANYGTINACGRPGGIVGYATASASFINCVNEGEIQSTANYCGGIAGRLGTDGADENMYLLENCVNRGKVIVWKSQGAGIVGYVGAPKIVEYKNCVNYGDVVDNPNNVSDLALAGIHGSNNVNAGSIIFENCVNYGHIGNGTLNHSKKIMAAGICAKVRTKQAMEFANCYNYGQVTASYRAGGIAAAAPYDSVPAGVNVTFLGCGNLGELTSAQQAAGITAYSYASWTYGPVVKYCFNTGDITGSTQVSGLIGYMNCGYAKTDIEYNFIAGNLKGADATLVTDGAAVKIQTQYSFLDSNGNLRYFYVPEAGTVAIAGDVVTFTATKPIAFQTVKTGDTSNAKNQVAVFEVNGTKYLALASGAKGSVVTVDEETCSLITNDVAVKGVEVPATFDGTTWVVDTYDHPISTFAICWNNKADITIDMSKNIVAEGTADLDYVTGAANTWSFTTSSDASEKTAIADFANGTVAYELNEMIGETVFYQNINEELFVVDAYPTTDATHAKVVKVAGVISNQLFDISNDSGSPATGDAMIYVVVALAVSTISLAAVAVVRKKKEN